MMKIVHTIERDASAFHIPHTKCQYSRYYLLNQLTINFSLNTISEIHAIHVLFSKQSKLFNLYSIINGNRAEINRPCSKFKSKFQMNGFPNNLFTCFSHIKCGRITMQWYINSMPFMYFSFNYISNVVYCPKVWTSCCCYFRQ